MSAFITVLVGAGWTLLIGVVWLGMFWAALKMWKSL